MIINQKKPINHIHPTVTIVTSNALALAANEYGGLAVNHLIKDLNIC
jgi:hypothetical protein